MFNDVVNIQAADNKPIVVDSKPAVPDTKPVVPDTKPVVPEIRPEIKPVVDARPIVDPRPVVEIRPAVDPKPAVVETKQVSKEALETFCITNSNHLFDKVIIIIIRCSMV